MLRCVNLGFFQSFIKEEPEDISSDVDEMDPTQFLAQVNDDEDDGEVDNDKHPPILASLGLTHISQVSLIYSNYFQFNLNRKINAQFLSHSQAAKCGQCQ